MQFHPAAHPQRGGILFKLFAFFLVCTALLVLAWMLFLPTLVAGIISSRTGFSVRVESLMVNPFTARVSLKGLVIQNPEDFSAKDFIELGEFRADAELASLMSDRIVIEEAAVHVKRLSLVKGRGPQSNAVIFKNRLLGESTSSSQQAQPSASSKQKDFLIRKLSLRFDKLCLVDASGPKPGIKEYNIDFHQNYENVTSSAQIATPVVGKLLASGGAIGDYAGKLGTQALEGLKKTGEALKDAGKKTGETLKDIFNSITEKTKK